MVKNFFTFLLLLSVMVSANAQKQSNFEDKNHVSKNTYALTKLLMDYSFEEGTTMYSSISGTGTSVIPMRDGNPNWDDGYYYLDLAGTFTFNYNETDYSSFSIQTNGPVLLGTDGYSTLGNDLNGTNGTYFYNPVIAGLWDDLRLYGEGTGDGLYYQLDGAPGSQVLTIEWYNIARYSYEGFQVSYQVKLYEANGLIEIIYGDMTAASNWVASASIGINDDEAKATVFWSVTPGTPATVSSSVANNTIDQTVIAAIPEGTSYSFSAGSEVTFMVDDGTNPVQDAHIYVNGSEYVTDASGEAVFVLPDGTYDYEIIASGFQNYTNSFSVAGVPINVPVSLIVGTDVWPIIFTVTGEDIEGGTFLLENADVTFNGIMQQTNAFGQTTFYESTGDYDYTVSLTNYDNVNVFGYTVNPQTNNISTNLDLSKYTITFTVAENFGVNDPIEGAEVTVTNSTKAIWTEFTDASGNVDFLLPITSYSYTVSADGYTEGSGSFSIVDQNITEDVFLDEDLAAPSGLTVETSDNDAVFSWYAGFSGSLLVVDHDATNSVTTFTDDWPYIQAALDALEINYTYYEADVTTFDGPDLATMQEHDAILWFTGEGWQNNQTMTPNDETNLAAYLDGGGKLFLSSQDYIWDVYSQADDYTFSSGQFPFDYLGVVSVHQDAWWTSGGEHIAHEGMIGSLAEGFSFYCDDIYTTAKDGLSADQITAHSAMDMLNVTDAPAGVTAIQNGNTVFWAGSLASITELESRTNFLMAVLDYLAVSKDKALLSYNVYIDDLVTPYAVNITDSTFQFVDLSYGSHTAGVQAVYTSGTSSVSTIEFDLFQTYIITFHVTDNNGGANLQNAHITLTDELAKTVWEGDTDVDGVVVFSDLQAGDYEYSVSLVDYDDIIDVPLTVSMTETIEVGMDESVGVNDLDKSMISIYPNPSVGVFKINSKTFSVLTITDYTGKTVDEIYINPGTSSIELNEKGFYLLNFKSDFGNFTEKVIVK